MTKKIFVYLMLVVFISVSFFMQPVFSESGKENSTGTLAVSKTEDKGALLDLKAKSALLIDAATGNVLYEKNIHEKLPLASVTKIMSMLLVMEAVDGGKIKLEDMVPVSEHSYNMGGSQVYLKPGEQFSVHEFLKAVAMHSANDGTVALAEFLAGSEEAFVTMMNQKAKDLGMNNTHFLDSTGLTDDGHYSTAYDISLMSKELIMKHPKILEYTSIWHDTFRDGKFSLDNTNRLIHSYKGSNGLKTGFTTKAGYCLSASALRNGLQLIAVVLGEPDANTRFAEAAKLLDYGFASYEISEINKKGEFVNELEIKKGLTTKVKAIYDNDVRLLLAKGEKGKIERVVKLDTTLTAPIKKGQKLGDVIFKVDGKEVGKAQLVAESEVKKASFFRLFFRMIFSWFGLGKG
ncbi:MAG: D-alanyl-D-alanine carboxypeptidase [Clostridia bacterium]|nr:D-alanyl-D-alanine carboxypeptidase [Clostridia bacterium]